MRAVKHHTCDFLYAELCRKILSSYFCWQSPVFIYVKTAVPVKIFECESVFCEDAYSRTRSVAQSLASSLFDDVESQTNAKKTLGEKVEYASSKEDAVKGADVLAILTEWEDFGKTDLIELKNLMKNPKIVDLRNMLKAKNPINEI